MTLYFVKAWLIGIAIAAPVGPVGLLCIRKTLELGFLGALCVGLGAALADSIYGLIAATGITAISGFLIQQTSSIKVIGGLFLIYLAYKEAVKKISGTEVDSSSKALKLITEVFFLTLMNPLTILSFMGVFATIGAKSINFIESFVIVFGIFLGSMTWWMILGASVIKIKHQLPPIWIRRIRYLSVLILGGFGLLTILAGLLF